jgi:hypothetical protein
MVIEYAEKANCWIRKCEILANAYFLSLWINLQATGHLNTTDQVDLRDGIGLAITIFSIRNQVPVKPWVSAKECQPD